MTQATLVERLREVAGLKVGTVRQPEWMKPNDWGPAISELCGEAATEIERLQKLAHEQLGESYADIREKIKRNVFG